MLPCCLMAQLRGGWAAAVPGHPSPSPAHIPSNTVLQQLLSQPTAASRMRADLHSRWLLIVWAAYCCIHASTGRTHPLLLTYGVPLDFHDLRHLVLSDRPAVDAMLGVAAYLQAHTRPGRAVFTLRDGGLATFELAASFAQHDARMMGIWRQELSDAEQRQRLHWDEVRRKQHLARKLEAQLATERAEKSRAHAALEAAKHDYETADFDVRSFYKGILIDKQRRHNDACTTCKYAERELKEALKSPTPVIQPLPKDEQAALQWLFFLYMPRLFRCGRRGSIAEHGCAGACSSRLAIPPLLTCPSLAHAGSSHA